MSTYGAGTATQFSDGTQRQVLELGPKIYYYNESVTPLLSISGRAGAVQTPVPIYEWMEDEYFIKRSVKTPIALAPMLLILQLVVLNRTSHMLLNFAGKRKWKCI